MRSLPLRLGWCLLPLLLRPAVAAAGPGGAPSIVLYTIGQGADVFEKLGHTALCVRPPEHPAAGVCFDYGTANFDDLPVVAWRFLRGLGSFGLSADPERTLLRDYARTDRTIVRQVLPLTPDQAAAVSRKLFSDARDPDWRYPYRLFDDNCATRVRDILDAALGGRLHAATVGRPSPGPSLRDLGRRGFAEVPVALLVVDLFLGRYADRVPDRWEAMAYPPRLLDGIRDVLGVEPETVRERVGPAFHDDLGWGARGWFLLLALVLAVPPALALRVGRGGAAAVAWAVVPLVILGAAVWFVAWASPLPEGRANELLAVFVPYDVVLPFLRAAGRRHYARVRIALLAGVSLLAAVGVFHQPLWAPLLVVFAPMAAFAFVAPRRAGEEPGGPDPDRH